MLNNTLLAGTVPVIFYDRQQQFVLDKPFAAVDNLRSYAHTLDFPSAHSGAVQSTAIKTLLQVF